MIVVLGATGNTGRALVKALSDKGAAFKCVVRDVDRAKGVLGDGVELVQGDLSQPATLEPAFSGGDKLFLLSGHSPALKTEQVAAVSAAKAAGIGFILKVSGAEGGIRPDSPAEIPRMHYEIEQEVINSGVPHAILRPGFFLQNLLMMAPVIAEQGKLITPVPGDVQISMIDVRDTADVAARVLTEGGHEGQIYALNGDAVTYTDIAAELGKQLGKEVPFVQVPKDAALGVMRERNMPDWLVEHMSRMIDAQSGGGMLGSGDTLRQMLGGDPRTLSGFIADHLKAFGG